MSVNQVGYLMYLVGKEVKVNRGGPDSVTGRLLSVQYDYLVVQTKDGIVYINSQHVKSISANTSGGIKGAYSDNANFIQAYNFSALLSRLRHQNVQVNRGGPEKVEGLVVDANQSFLLIVVKKEIVRIPIFHIKTLSLIGKSKGNSQNSNQNTNNQNKSGQSQGNKNKSGQSQGNKNKSGQSQGNKNAQSQGNKNAQSRGNASSQSKGSKKGGKSGGSRGNVQHFGDAAVFASLLRKRIASKRT